MTAGSAFGQARINNGNALDANNRIGSGGYNQGAGDRYRGPYAGYTATDVINANVTAGKAFRGPVPYRDPGAFTGPTAGNEIDRFVRDSSGTPYSGYGGYNSNAQVARVFYPDSNRAAPPPGFVQQGPSGGYVASSAPQTRLGSDLRVGDPIDTQMVPNARPGQLMLPGPVDASNQDTLLTASPLYGVRAWRVNNPQDQQFVQRYTDLYNYNTVGRSALDDTRMRQYRQELFGGPTSQPSGGGAAPINTSVPAPGAGTLGGDSLTLNPGAKPISNAIQPDQVNGQAVATNVPPTEAGAQPIDTSTVQSGQSFTQRVIPPAQQSTQYAQLQQRLKQYYGDRPLSDADRARIYNAQIAQLRKDREQAVAKAQPPKPAGGAAETAQPGGLAGAKPAELKPGETAIAEPAIKVPGPTGLNGLSKPKPPQIHSMQSLITPKAKGVGEILKTAEDLMRQGKFIDALAQYDTAEQIGAKYAAVQLGRANAELGASYYTRADSGIRQAFTQDPSLLEGQYDLSIMIGEERLQFLVKDLKEIVRKEPTQARPLFLLAYIAYNTGNERMAAGYLDLAEKRAGPNDPFYKLVREHWVLPQEPSGAPTDQPATAPSTQPAGELNK
jgi:hypothetical protein